MVSESFAMLGRGLGKSQGVDVEVGFMRAILTGWGQIEPTLM